MQNFNLRSKLRRVGRGGGGRWMRGGRARRNRVRPPGALLLVQERVVLRDERAVLRNETGTALRHRDHRRLLALWNLGPRLDVWLKTVHDVLKHTKVIKKVLKMYLNNLYSNFCYIKVLK